MIPDSNVYLFDYGSLHGFLSGSRIRLCHTVYPTDHINHLWKGEEKTDRKLRAIKEIEIQIQIELGLTHLEQSECVWCCNRFPCICRYPYELVQDCRSGRPEQALFLGYGRRIP